MCPDAFPRDQVRKTISVEVHELQRMRFGKARVDHVLYESPARLLLVPPDPELVGGARYHVGKTIAVHVENVHLCGIGPQVDRREWPRRRARILRNTPV